MADPVSFTELKTVAKAIWVSTLLGMFLGGVIVSYEVLYRGRYFETQVQLDPEKSSPPYDIVSHFHVDLTRDYEVMMKKPEFSRGFAEALIKSLGVENARKVFLDSPIEETAMVNWIYSYIADTMPVYFKYPATLTTQKYYYLIWGDAPDSWKVRFRIQDPALSEILIKASIHALNVTIADSKKNAPEFSIDIFSADKAKLASNRHRLLYDTEIKEFSKNVLEIQKRTKSLESRLSSFDGIGPKYLGKAQETPSWVSDTEFELTQVKSKRVFREWIDPRQYTALRERILSAHASGKLETKEFESMLNETFALNGFHKYSVIPMIAIETAKDEEFLDSVSNLSAAIKSNSTITSLKEISETSEDLERIIRKGAVSIKPPFMLFRIIFGIFGGGFVGILIGLIKVKDRI